MAFLTLKQNQSFPAQIPFSFRKRVGGGIARRRGASWRVLQLDGDDGTETNLLPDSVKLNFALTWLRQIADRGFPIPENEVRAASARVGALLCSTLFASQAHMLRVFQVRIISWLSGLVASLQPLTIFTSKIVTFSTKLPRSQEKNTSNGRNPVAASWAHVPSWPSWSLGSGSCIKPVRAAAPSILTYPHSFVRLSLGEVAEMLLLTLWDLTESWQLCPVLLGFPSLLPRAAQEKGKYITSVSSAGQAGTETKAAVRILPIGWEQVGG